MHQQSVVFTPRWLASCICLLTSIVVFESPPCAYALIIGDEGNAPLTDPGWQPGAAAVFNVQARVAYWEGPPFGGGQYVAECRGNADTLNTVLADFAKIEAPQRQLYVHDGIGNSFWLNTNGEAGKRQQAEIDWTFTAWIPENWKRFRHGATANPNEVGPIPELHVYTGGQISWADVKVPAGIDVLDERLAAHGYTTADGTVLDGHITNLETNAPIAAHIELQRIIPRPTGGYDYETTLQTDANAQGKWAMKSVPDGWYQVVASAEGYVTRTVTYETVKPGPRWVKVDSSLAQPGPISGTVVDADGKPLNNVQVNLDHIIAAPGQSYAATLAENILTNAQGHFTCDQLPRGKVTLWVHKDGYCRPGLGLKVETPSNDIKLVMQKSATLLVRVEFKKTPRAGGYIVEIAPEGEGGVGTWGGSGNIDDDNKISFTNVPPGKYVLHGHPNPSSANEATQPKTIELIGGKTELLIIEAK